MSTATPTRPADAVVERALAAHLRRRPVDATFIGVHDHDDRLPDWSRAALAAADDEMAADAAALARAFPAPGDDAALADDPTHLDAALLGDALTLQRAELASGHGVRGNPALWTGEAIFAIVALVTRDFARLDERVALVRARLAAIPAFLAEARATLADALPAPWVARARRECDGAAILLGAGLRRWVGGRLEREADDAARAFASFAGWLDERPAAPPSAMSCGAEQLDLLLARGHRCARPRGELLAEARARLVEERARLDGMAREVAGSWPAVQAALAAHHPAPDDYLPAFARTWEACLARATDAGVVTWADWPLRYTVYPDATRDAAPYLYYLHYRSPAPFDPYTVHDYVVPALGDDPEAQLRVWNHAAIKLNHVVHHGAIGHHVQNWHAYHRAPTRVGRIAAVDCASRIALFSGGTMAEGWACYATALMEELGFLTPLERVSEQHSRVRFLVRAVGDLAFHAGEMTFDELAGLHEREAGLAPEAARGEAAKCAMFPGTASMYWIGTQGITDLRASLAAGAAARGEPFALRDFHDALLGHGSLPVPLVARMMTREASSGARPRAGAVALGGGAGL